MKENLLESKENQQRYEGNNTKNISFEIREPVYFKNQRKRHSLNKAILYRYKRLGAVSYKIKDQLM